MHVRFLNSLIASSSNCFPLSSIEARKKRNRNQLIRLNLFNIRSEIGRRSLHEDLLALLYFEKLFLKTTVHHGRPLNAKVDIKLQINHKSITGFYMMKALKVH